MSFRISVDIGGTFTDLVVMDEHGGVETFKASTTPENYVEAVLDNLGRAARHHGMSLSEMLSQGGGRGASFIHGSTITTNALIEGKVARTGLICTRGFRDILTIREGGKKEPFNWRLLYPEPFIPRCLTLPVTERVNSEGGVETPLDDQEAAETVRRLKALGVEAIAVCLLWAIINPEHELRLGDIIRRECPELPYVLSHQVNPIIREYRRTISTAINASLIPIVGRYVSTFEGALEEKGFPGGMLMLTSSGGVMSTEEIVKKPIYTVDCGPSLAPAAGLWFGRTELGRENVITADMGGTSFDIACVTDGVIAVSREGWIKDDMLGINKVDSKSIGSGGGSIAWVDPGGMLQVGPQSAGARPGPACYGRGGDQPTVTDANLILGYLDPEYFLGGAMPLYRSSAERAVREKVAEPLGLSLEEAAFSIFTTVNVNMVSAIKDITVWQGIDPREYLLVSGGGAAGLHIMPVAGELGAREILIPKTASVISALGGALADVTAEFSLSRWAESNRFDYEGVNSGLAELEFQADRFLDQSGVPRDRRRLEFHVEARYLHQVWELSVPLAGKRIGGPADLEALIESFHETHEKILGIKEPGQAIECIFWRVKAVGLLKKPTIAAAGGQGKNLNEALKGRRPAYFRSWGGMTDTPIYDGGRLGAGIRVSAPAIIEEPNMTVVLFPGGEIRVTDLGSYHMVIEAERRVGLRLEAG
ncbi:MAG: hydantoinase/oxoprolinase family protein [Thermodesulfobacteriota bacterium]